MLKRAKLVMLPSNQKATSIGLYTDTNKLVFNNPNNKDIPRGVYQHLYILSDEEIKDSDWVKHGILDDIYQVNKDNLSASIHNKSKKIIATTDNSLIILQEPNYPRLSFSNSLPQPSQSFIENYIEKYNQHKQITDVMIEYDNLYFDKYGNQQPESWANSSSDKKIISNKLKINPRDNTITIKPIKDSWNRDEIIDLIKKALFDASDLITKYPDGTTSDIIKDGSFGFNKWIEENL